MASTRNLQRALAHGGNATLVTVLVVVLVGVLYGVADRHRARFDFSAEGANQLAPDTLKRLELLDSEGVEVRITSFTAQEGKDETWFKNRTMRDFLQELDHASGVVRWKQVDFDRERLTAESMGVTEYGHLVLQRGDERVDIKDRELFRREGKGADRKVAFIGEAAVARGLSQLLSKQQLTVYALVGHGERDVTEVGPGGYADLAQLLLQENYKLEPLDLIRDREADEAPSVPTDAGALLIARPMTPLTPPEEDAVLAYVAGGGSVAVFLDPGTPVPDLLRRLAIDVPGGSVADKLLIFPYKDRPVPRYRQHDITRDLAEQELITMFAHVAPLRVRDPAPAWGRYANLVEGGRESWIDRGGLLDGGAAVYEPDVDAPGPAVIAVAVEVSPAEDGLVRSGPRSARVVVTGDSDFAAGGVLLEGPGNPTLAVNVFRWLLRDDPRLSVVGRATRVRRLALTEEDQGRIRWMVLGLMPVLTLTVGAGVWASRRGR